MGEREPLGAADIDKYYFEGSPIPDQGPYGKMDPLSQVVGESLPDEGIGHPDEGASKPDGKAQISHERRLACMKENLMN